MSTQRELIEEIDLEGHQDQSVNRSQTSIYVTDLLSELQVIAHLGGLEDLAKDIEAIVTKHV